MGDSDHYTSIYEFIKDLTVPQTLVTPVRHQQDDNPVLPWRAKPEEAIFGATRHSNGASKSISEVQIPQR